MICPMFGTRLWECNEKDCAWWDKYWKQCGVQTAFQALGKMASKQGTLMDVIDKLIDKE